MNAECCFAWPMPVISAWRWNDSEKLVYGLNQASVRFPLECPDFWAILYARMGSRVMPGYAKVLAHLTVDSIFVLSH